VVGATSSEDFLVLITVGLHMRQTLNQS